MSKATHVTPNNDDEADISIDAMPAYRTASLNRINAKYKTSLVYLADIEEIDGYLSSHPDQSKIGFIVTPPRILGDDFHHSPILFERRDNEEYFVQFDATRGLAYALPLSTTDKTRTYLNGR
jgi:hypothetical protein